MPIGSILFERSAIIRQRVLHTVMRMRWDPWLTGGLVIVLCWVAAQWTWLAFAPRAALAHSDGAPVAASAAAASVSSLHLFGRAPANRKQAEGAAVTPLNLKLMGVFAAIGNLPGFAILSVDGKPPQPVQAGASIAPGVVLAAVLPDRVELNRQGSVERLNLEIRTGTRGSASTAVADARSVQPRASDKRTIARNEITQAIQYPKQLANLGKISVQPGGAGMLVEEASPGSLAEKLGLQAGDVINRLDGQILTTREDLGRFYQQLNQNGQVKLRVARSGRPLLMEYAVQ